MGTKRRTEKNEEKTHRVLAQVISPWEEQAGIEAPRSYAMGDFMGAYGEGSLANVWVYRAVRAKSDAVSQLPILYQGRSRGKKEEWTTIMDGDVAKIFRDINPQMSYYDFAEATTSYMELSGNCFLALENGDPRSGKPREMWPMRPDLVKIHPDEETGEVLGYSVQLNQGGVPILYSRDEMIHWKYFNPRNWFWGLSPLSAHRMGLSFNYHVQQYENNFFKHGVRETGILVTGGQLSDPQYERLKRQVETRYGGVERMHRPMLLEGGLDWKRISVPPKDMEYLGMREWNRDEIQAIFGVPPLKLMDLKEASVLANADMQEKLFWSDAIIPMLRKFEGYYREFLLPLFISPSDLPYHRLIYDLTSIRAFQLDEKSRAEIAAKLTTGSNPLFSVNEARDRFYSLPPVPWGAEPFIPSALIPASVLGGGAAVGGQEQLAAAITELMIEKMRSLSKENGVSPAPFLLPRGAESRSALPPLSILEKCDGDEEEGRAKDPYSEEYILDLIPEFPISQEHQAYWRDWAMKRLKDEERFVKALNTEFRRELADMLANLRSYEGSQALLSAESLLFDEDRAIDEMTNIYLTQFGFIFRKTTAEEIESWGLEDVESFDSPTVLEYGTNQASWFAGTGRANLLPGQYPGVTGTQLNNLEKALNIGLDAGESIPELTKRVQQVFAGSIRENGYAARRIARTETIRLSNYTRLVQYQRNSDVIDARQWIAQLDSRVEEICARLHGEVAELGKVFTGGFMQPPDPHPACRCTTIPRLREEEEEE